MERFNQDFGDCCNVFRLIKKFKLKKKFNWIRFVKAEKYQERMITFKNSNYIICN